MRSLCMTPSCYTVSHREHAPPSTDERECDQYTLPSSLLTGFEVTRLGCGYCTSSIFWAAASVLVSAAIHDDIAVSFASMTCISGCLLFDPHASSFAGIAEWSTTCVLRRRFLDL